ncbi:DUF4240 domain-containing protein [Streptomyces stramineus]
MNTDTFWQLIDTARAADAPLQEALTDLLVAQGEEQVLAFEVCMGRLDTVIDRWDVWAVSYLVCGGCSDDSFMDFKAGLISLGRTWYERVARCPDDLAEHPDIQHAFATGVGEAVFCEEMGYVTAAAWERLTSNRDSFYPALDHYRVGHGVRNQDHDMGQGFDFDNADEMRQRLPQLAALYLEGVQR